ncbi:hypothetical protein HDU67_008737 [Dinochytrium kinnereticum]|nr:hypothetical protein HDU67_008737 [Dinochytrium kinnereticum]
MGDFQRQKLGSFELITTSVLMNLTNTEIVESLRVEAQSGAVYMGFVKAGKLTLNLNRASLTMDEIYLDEGEMISSIGNMIGKSIMVLKSLKLSSDYGTLVLMGIKISGQLKAFANKGEIIVQKLFGPYNLIDVRSGREGITMEDLDASTSAIGSVVQLQTASGTIGASILGYKGKIFMESISGQVSAKGDHLEWLKEAPQRLVGGRFADNRSQAMHELTTNTRSGNAFITFI